MTLLLTLVPTLIAVVIIIVGVNRVTRKINQLERDLTYLMNEAEKSIEKEEEIYQEIKTTVKMPIPQNPIQMLKEAKITDKKAYVATELAAKHGWQVLDIQGNIKMVRFMRAENGDVQKVNVYYGGKGGRSDLYTLATALNHPTKGKTQLFRKFIDTKELEEVLKNPRIHTQKGYYRNGK